MKQALHHVRGVLCLFLYQLVCVYTSEGKWTF